MKPIVYTLIISILKMTLIHGQIQLVKDVNYGLTNTQISCLTELNGKLIFVCNDNLHGNELWITDGTNDGTQLLRDIKLGPSGSDPNNLIKFNDKIIFAANDGINGNELWITDGTTVGTKMVKNLNENAYSSDPKEFIIYSGAIYFNGDGVNDGTELWKTDGTYEGTILVANINDNLMEGSYPHNFTVVNFPAYGEFLLFNANDKIKGAELFYYDAVSNVFDRVSDIYVGDCAYSCDSDPYLLTTSGNVVYFRAENTANGVGFWKCVGPHSVNMYPDIYYPPFGSDSDPSDLTKINDTYIFWSERHYSYGRELFYSYQGSSTRFLTDDLYSGNNSSNPEWITSFNDVVYFSAANGLTGTELYKCEFPYSNIEIVKDIYSGSYGSMPEELFVANNKLYFSAKTFACGRELYVSTGTADSTFLIEDFYPGTNSSNPHSFCEAGKYLYFIANSITYGEELHQLQIKNEYIVSIFSEEGVQTNHENTFSYIEGDTILINISLDSCYVLDSIKINGLNITPSCVFELTNLSQDTQIEIFTTMNGVTSYYYDFDEDGFGDVNFVLLTCSTTQPTAYSINSLDCNDENELVNPIAIELCDGLDNNCNDYIDEINFDFEIVPMGSTTLCSGENVNLFSNYHSDSISYQWYCNDLPIAGENSDSLHVNKSGEYYLIISNYLGCYQQSNFIQINVNKIQKPTILAPNGTDLCNQTSVKLKANTVFTNSVQWLLNGNILEGATNKTYITNVVGNYQLEVTNPNGCSKLSSPMPIVKTCKIDSIAGGFSIHVFPNPATSYLIIESDKILQKIQLFNNLGQQIEIEIIQSNYEYQINVPRVLNGIFFLTIETNDNYVIQNKISFQNI